MWIRLRMQIPSVVLCYKFTSVSIQMKNIVLYFSFRPEPQDSLVQISKVEQEKKEQISTLNLRKLFSLHKSHVIKRLMLDFVLSKCSFDVFTILCDELCSQAHFRCPNFMRANGKASENISLWHVFYLHFPRNCQPAFFFFQYCAYTHEHTKREKENDVAEHKSMCIEKNAS